MFLLQQTFVVRKSKKARYALSLRVPVDDPAVSHFLIQTNQQSKSVFSTFYSYQYHILIKFY